MKKRLCFFLVLVLSFVLCGCCLKHEMQPATCTEPSFCAKCGKAEGEPLGHVGESIPAVEPTCIEAGLTEGTRCSVCGEILVPQETINALGHVEESIPAVEPTCTEAGLTEGTRCSVCGEILVPQETIDSLGHDWESATFFLPKTCRRCGATEGAGLGSDYLVELILPAALPDNEAESEPDDTRQGAAETETASAGSREFLISAESRGFAGLDSLLSDSSIRLTVNAAQEKSAVFGADFVLNDSEPLSILLSFEKDGLRLALPGVADSSYSISYQTLLDLTGIQLDVGNLPFSAGNTAPTSLKETVKGLGELARRYAGILFSVANVHNTEENAGPYYLEGLKREVNCRHISCTPGATEWRAMLRSLISTARDDEQLQSRLAALIRMAAANPQGLRAVYNLGYSDADALIRDLPELFNRMLESADDLAYGLDGITVDIAAEDGRLYAFKLSDDYGEGIGYESFGDTSGQRQDAYVSYDFYDDESHALVIALHELNRYGDTVKGKLSFPGEERSFSYLLRRQDDLLSFDARYLDEDIVISAVLDGAEAARQFRFNLDLEEQELNVSILRTPGEATLAIPDEEPIELHSQEDMTAAAESLLPALLKTDLVGRILEMTSREEPASEEPAAAASAAGLFVLSGASDYSFTGEVLEKLDVSARYDMLTVEDLVLPEKTHVTLIRDGKTYLASVDNTDFEGQLVWEEDPFDSEGQPVLASRIAIENGDVLVQLILENDGNLFLREYVFKPI